MIGMVLAAGAGRRLHPLTDDLPKTLLPVVGDRTVLDIAIGNLAAAGLTDIAIVTGFARERIDERVNGLQERYGVTIETIVNDKALEWNNAYSLWLARGLFPSDVLLCNGDTVHPASVERTLLAARGTTDIVLAVDDRKPLAEEEMKVVLDGDGRLQRITKLMDPAEAAGEYVGLTLIEAAAAADLADALEATWRRDPQLYYEDGYQAYVDRGGSISVAPIGTLDWVEVDNHDDLARARDVACHY